VRSITAPPLRAQRYLHLPLDQDAPLIESAMPDGRVDQ
jgi:hypothetical protein